jgi:hypothetical protein
MFCGLFGAIPLATQPKVGQGACVSVPSLTADLEHSFEYGAVLRPPALRPVFKRQLHRANQPTSVSLRVVSCVPLPSLCFETQRASLLLTYLNDIESIGPN